MKVLAYLDKLKPECEVKVMSYEEKVARREAEIEGLKEALGILEGEDISTGTLYLPGVPAKGVLGAKGAPRFFGSGQSRKGFPLQGKSSRNRTCAQPLVLSPPLCFWRRVSPGRGYPSPPHGE